MSKRAPNRDAVATLLRARGPMAIDEIALELGWERDTAARAVLWTRHMRPGEFFRIVGYRWQDGSRGREIPIYAADGGEDKPRPRVTDARRAAQKKAYLRRHSARINAKARAKRAEGREANPWLQLAAPEIRTMMTRTARQL